MKINDFISGFQNHPVLFIGTGMSLRYLENSYTWDELLYEIVLEITNNEEVYYDIKAKYSIEGNFDYASIASDVQELFIKYSSEKRDGKFKEVNDIFYENMKEGIKLNRFKIYLSEIFQELNYRKGMEEEINKFKKVRKNIGSVITTNYDCMVEDIFDFNPLIGNDILLSNPYGSVYKIHGCIKASERIIISKEDYEEFDKKYELIRAQLLSLFIHNPIIFLGYSMGDKNIKDILQTIYTYVDPNSDTAEKIRSNFLLVEYDKGNDNKEVVEHDIILNENQTVRINKIKTDDYNTIYESLSSLQLPVSAMDVRKVQNIVKEIYSGGSVKVSITEDLNELSNDDKVLVIGSNKTIQYIYQTSSEVINNYFEIIEEENVQLLNIIDKFNIQSQQYFPIYGFDKLNPNIAASPKLKVQQNIKLEKKMEDLPLNCKVNYESIKLIVEDPEIANTNREKVILYSVMNNYIPLSELKEFLGNYEDKTKTNYRMLLCAYDYLKYSDVWH